MALHSRFMTTQEVLDIFRASWEEDGNGCWIWKGWLNGGGYGSLRSENGHPEAAYRFSMRVLGYGWPPKGMDAGHTCEVKLCVNPLHLKPMTKSSNTRMQERCKRCGKCGEPFGYEYTNPSTGRVLQKCGPCNDSGRPKPSWVARS